MAVQAFLAVFITAAFALLFHWERAYWAILTAILMISQTWGESVKRAFERIVMTIIGGIVGTLLFLAVHSLPWLGFVILCICVFCIVYFTAISYFVTVFFVTIMLVFLFATILGWNFHMLWTRILETIIGATVAVSVSLIVLPIRTKVNLTKEIVDFIQLIQKTTVISFESLLSPVIIKSRIMKDRMALINKITVIQTQVQAARFELFYTDYSRKTLQKVLIYLRLIAHYTSSLLEASRQMDESLLTIDIKQQLQQLQKQLTHNLMIIYQHLSHQKEQDAMQSTRETRKKIWELTQQLQINPNDTFKQLAPLLALLYFSRKHGLSWNKIDPNLKLDDPHHPRNNI